MYEVAHNGFVWAKIDRIYVGSCYALPILTFTEFEDMLDKLVLDVKARKSRSMPVISMRGLQGKCLLTMVRFILTGKGVMVRL